MNGGNEERFRSIVKTLPPAPSLRKGFPCVKVNVRRCRTEAEYSLRLRRRKMGRTWLNTIFAGCCPEGILGSIAEMRGAPRQMAEEPPHHPAAFRYPSHAADAFPIQGVTNPVLSGGLARQIKPPLGLGG